MKKREDLFSRRSSNPVLHVDKYGTVFYSNEAGELLLKIWGLKIGEKISPNIQDIVKRVLLLNSPEKIEVKLGIRVYLIVFHPFYEKKCVYISGFDLDNRKEIEDKLQESIAKETENDEKQNVR